MRDILASNLLGWHKYKSTFYKKHLRVKYLIHGMTSFACAFVLMRVSTPRENKEKLSQILIFLWTMLPPFGRAWKLQQTLTCICEEFWWFAAKLVICLDYTPGKVLWKSWVRSYLKHNVEQVASKSTHSQIHFFFIFVVFEKYFLFFYVWNLTHSYCFLI